MHDLSAEEQERLEDEAKKLTLEDVAKLETKLISDEDDIATRFKLVVAYQELPASMPERLLEFDPDYAEDFSIPVKPYIGLKLQKQSETQVCVLEASDGSPAQTAGLASNDLIISVNSEPIFSIDQFLNIIPDCNPNLDIQIAISRNNKRLLFNLNPFVQDAYQEKK